MGVAATQLRRFEPATRTVLASGEKLKAAMVSVVDHTRACAMGGGYQHQPEYCKITIQTWCWPLGSPDSVNHTMSPAMAMARGRSGVKYTRYSGNQTSCCHIGLGTMTSATASGSQIRSTRLFRLSHTTAKEPSEDTATPAGPWRCCRSEPGSSSVPSSVRTVCVTKSSLRSTCRVEDAHTAKLPSPETSMKVQAAARAAVSTACACSCSREGHRGCSGATAPQEALTQGQLETAGSEPVPHSRHAVLPLPLA